MLELNIFTDASVHSESKVGYGAYLLLAKQDNAFGLLKNNIKTKRFEQTSSTKLELQTLLWALEEILTEDDAKASPLTIYTDCQNIISLPDRQARLEKTQYLNSKNCRLNHHLLYQKFYQLTSEITCNFIKVKGHQRSNQKNALESLFGLVDKASRQALRAAVAGSKPNDS
jgi:ribonuclease HI